MTSEKINGRDFQQAYRGVWKWVGNPHPDVIQVTPVCRSSCCFFFSSLEKEKKKNSWKISSSLFSFGISSMNWRLVCATCISNQTFSLLPYMHTHTSCTIRLLLLSLCFQRRKKKRETDWHDTSECTIHYYYTLSCSIQEQRAYTYQDTERERELGSRQIQSHRSIRSGKVPTQPSKTATRWLYVLVFY